ncbi:MAG: alpha/beta fold hydrolase, partial [Pseudomonadota bacterium]
AENDEATILIFHGNGDAAILQQAKGETLVNAGFGVLLVEYRGYPGSTGHPSEHGLYEDARSAYDFVSKSANGPVGLYAHSLGTGVAVNLATERDIFAVVLESPYDSIQAVAQGLYWYFPVSFLLKHKFLSDEKIEKVTAPILAMHGLKDTVIPIEHGRALAERASKQMLFEEIEGAGHNDLASFGTELRAATFFAKQIEVLK